MNRFIVIMTIMAIGFASCSKVPITNRKQLNLLPESQVMAMSLTAYNDFLTENKPVSNNSDAQTVRRVGQNIADAATAYLRKNKQLKRVKDFNWEFNLIEDDLVNAWAMPGGKVVFYTGILPITQSDNGMAVVMGHEVAHAIARHGNERMSQGLAAQLGGLGLQVALSQKPQQTQQIFNQAYGIGSQVGMLSFSRKHESEADKMGLVFMAMAGYDPKEAVPFWGRMAAASDGAAPPEFLSTHPNHDRRIEDLNEFMPIAMEYYNPSALTKSNNSNTNNSQSGKVIKSPDSNTNTNTNTDTNTTTPKKRKIIKRPN